METLIAALIYLRAASTGTGGAGSRHSAKLLEAFFEERERLEGELKPYFPAAEYDEQELMREAAAQHGTAR